MAQEISVTYQLVDRVTTNLKKISDALDNYEQRLKDLDKTTKDMSKDKNNNLSNWAKQGGESFDDLAKHTKKFNDQAARWSTVGAYATRVGEVGTKANTASGKVHALNAKLESLNTLVDEGTAKLGDFASTNEMVGESSKVTAGHIREQASAIRDLRTSIPALTQAMRSVAKVEHDVATAMLTKNKAAKEQIGLLHQVGRKSDAASNRMGGLRKETNRFGETLREVGDINFFGDGFDAGAMMGPTFVKLAGAIPLVTLSAGGLVSMLNSLGAGAVGLAGSMTTLAGSLVAIPGLYAAIGVAAAGAAGVMSTIVTPATEGVEKLKGLTDQVTAAQAAVSAANDNISQARSQAASATTPAGSASALAGIEDAYNAQTAAQTNLNKLLEESADIQKTIPPRAQELVDKIEAVKDSWRALWWGKDGKRAGEIIGTIIEGMSTVQDLMTLLEPAVERFARTMEKVGQYFKELSKDPAFMAWLPRTLTLAQDNFNRLFAIGKDFLPVVMALSDEMQIFTGWILDAVKEWSGGLDPAKLKEKFHEYLLKSFQSLKVWVGAILNFGHGIKTILGESNGSIELFETRLTSVSKRFDAWSTKVTENGDAAQYFANSFRVLDGVGAVLLAIVSLFGDMGKNTSATDSVVKFLDQLAGGIRAISPYMQTTVERLGPSMSKLFTALGDFTASTQEPLLNTVVGIVDGFTDMVKWLNDLPGPIKAAVAAFLPLNLALMAVGFAAGNALYPFGRLKGFYTKIVGPTNAFRKALWGQAAAQEAVNLANAGSLAPGWSQAFGKGSKGGKAAKGGSAGKAGAASGLAALGTNIGPKAGGFTSARGGAAALSTGAAGLPALASVGPAAAGAIPVIAALAAVVVVLGAAFLAFKDNTLGVADAIKRAWALVSDRFNESAEKMKKALGGDEGISNIVNVIKTVLEYIGGAILMNLISMFTSASGIFFTIVDTVAVLVAHISNMSTLIGQFISQLMDGNLGGAFKTLGSMLWETIKLPFKMLGTFVGGIFRTMFDTILTVFGSGMAGLINVGIDALNAMIDVANKISPVKIDKMDKFDYNKTDAGMAIKAREQLGKDEENAKNASAADGARYAGYAAKYGVKAPAKKAEKKKPDASVSSAMNAGSQPGYVGTAPTGAQIKWDLTTVTSFNAKTDDIDKKFMNLMARIKRLGPVVKIGMDGMLTQINKAKNPILLAMEELASGMVEPFTTHLGELVDQVNSVLSQTGSSTQITIGATGSGGSSGGSSGGTTPRRGGRQLGDSNAPVASVSGPLATGDTAGLSSAMEPALRLAAQMGATVSSGLRPGAVTSSGLPSDHGFGNAIDLVSPSSQLASAMNNLPGVKQVIYSPWGWARDGAAPTPVSDAGVKANHYDHVHVAMGGGGTGNGGNAGATTLDPFPTFKESLFSGVMTGLGDIVYDALSGMVGGTGGAGGGAAYGGDKADLVALIKWAANQYGANPEGMVRIARAESSLDPNAWNKTDSNAQAGIPSKGLFQFIESTFNSFATGAKAAKPGAWSDVPMAWLDPTAQSLAASWAFMNGKAAHWTTMAAYGRGGDFITNGPTPIMTGDNPGGRERVTVTPITGPRAGGRVGGNHTFSTTVVVQGGHNVDTSAFKELAQDVGAVVVKEIVEMMNGHAGDDI